MAERLAVSVLSVLAQDTASTGHLVLFQPARPISRPTQYLQDFILPALKATAAENGLVSLSATQVGCLWPAAVICTKLQEGQWAGYKAAIEDYKVIISPVIEASEGPYDTNWEECPSLPGIRGLVRRPNRISTAYYTEDNKEAEETLSGFEARVLLHEIDHMHGLTLLHAFTSRWRVKFQGNERFEALAEEYREVVLAAAKLHLILNGKKGEIQEEELEEAIRETYMPARHTKMITALLATLHPLPAVTS